MYGVELIIVPDMFSSNVWDQLKFKLMDDNFYQYKKLKFLVRSQQVVKVNWGVFNSRYLVLCDGNDKRHHKKVYKAIVKRNELGEVYLDWLGRAPRYPGYRMQYFYF